MRSKLFAFALLLFSCCTLASEKTEVLLYTYHLKPPFIVDLKAKSGLYFDLARYLNGKNKSYRFITAYIPKKRLEYLMDKGDLDGLVVGVNPLWFNDKAESKYIWLNTIYSDRDEFVSLETSPFEYKSKDSLTGKSVAGVAGYYYKGINEAVRLGSVKRIDTIGERQVLELISKQRADFGIVSRSVFKYLAKHEALQNDYYFSTLPHDAYDRRVMTTQKNQKLAEAIEAVVSAMPSDPKWQSLVNQYQ